MPTFTIELSTQDLDTLHEHRIKQMPTTAPKDTALYIKWLLEQTIESYSRSIQEDRVSKLSAHQLKRALDSLLPTNHDTI